MFRLCSVFLMLLAGCMTTAPDVVSGYSVHSQRGFVLARPEQVSRDADSLVLASPAVEQRDGRTIWSVQTSVVRNGPNYPIISEVWSFGAELDYHKRDRRRGPSVIRCLREEIGEIRLTRTQFSEAAVDGFTFELIGRRGNYSGTIPASAFRRILDRIGIPVTD